MGRFLSRPLVAAPGVPASSVSNGQLAERADELPGVYAVLDAASEDAGAILDSLADGILSVDNRGRVTFANRAALELTGSHADELLGKSHHDLIHHTRPDGTAFPHEACPIDAVLNTGDVARHDHDVFWRRDGTSFPIEYVSAPLHSGDAIVGATIAFRDVTERRCAEQEVAEARDRALEGSRMKSEFLANMSHELRTPLNGVIGMNELLLDTGLDDLQRGYARTACDSGEALLSVINDILDFSKIEAGKLELDPGDFDLVETLHGAVSTLAQTASAKGIELRRSVDPDLPARVNGDQGRLRQILINLLSNAVKFTAHGEVVLAVHRAPESGSGPVVRFEVRDTGIGIDGSKIDEVFGAYTQADVSTTRKYGGTGLGLAISRQLVDLMGGEIGASSSRREGSVFWFTIPLKSAGEDPGPLENSLCLVDGSGGPRQVISHVLLAEDDPVNRMVAEALLDKHGVETDIAVDGEQAVEMAGGGSYDAIFMDCEMPKLDGFQATMAIRRLELSERHTPVIAMTAHALEGDRERCLAAGMDDYLAKPLRPGDLDEMLAKWLEPDVAEGTEA